MKYKMRVIKESNSNLLEMARAIEESFGDESISKKEAKRIIDASGSIIDENDERLVGLNTISKLFEFFEMPRLIEEMEPQARKVLSAIRKEV